MKRLLALLGIILIAGTAFSQQEKVKWYSFEEAIEMNKKNPKMVLIDVYTDWCGWCTKMKKTTFNHPGIAKFINEKFYPVRFDAESDKPLTFRGKTYVKQGNRSRSSHQLAIKLLDNKMSYPSVVYLDERNNKITTVAGYIKPKDMEVILKYFAWGVFRKEKYEVFQKSLKHTLVKE